ncbi:hypothetical protein PCH_Pc12g10910 [Penicillium rubens Wisconsin 54-1255]|uniref:Uncharacterized protein n=1 Tax=Penicillium rubens (strain ATCC 28089 / DSM 1075 / NRRL 1951 / Wisconsin 54-1255) TaxID=500485 RepID=B6GWT4_PENRW|nr:hypothetical protein PCH_Pc12g10910 [Penicillium rubens Wisconsin 54-1255]
MNMPGISMKEDMEGAGRVSTAIGENGTHGLEICKKGKAPMNNQLRTDGVWIRNMGINGDLQGIGQIMYCPKWVLHGVLSIVRGRVIAALFASLGCGYQSHSQEQSWNVWIVPRV